MYRVSSPCRMPLDSTQARTCGVKAYKPLPWVGTVSSWKTWYMGAILANLLCYTRSMLFLIPHLFPTTRLLQAAAQDLRLPALQTLLARGTRRSCPADGVVAGAAYWLRADPVHLQVMRDRIVLADSSAFELTQSEADALATAIGQHFGADLSPMPLHPRRWYLRLEHAPRLTTTPPSVAAGRNLDPLLPQGEDAMQFRARLNELQMLLHDHPVNLAREARGELSVNALWLWGGGQPPCPATGVPLYARDADVQALGA